ncbi:MAG: cytochrome b/b6 domain-containing protein [Rhodoferax sp.]|nr:cytochrome b/b6 domain-containing protein [Rhodoferax sp.]
MQTKQTILVWDAPTRLFHWLMVLCFAGAWLTAEGSRLLGVHLTLGYTMVALVAWRVLWGVIGTRYARFASFVRGPQAVLQHFRDLLSPAASHPVGHNPLGAVSIMLMLALTLLIVASGWVYFSGGPRLLKELHEASASLMLAVVGVHIAGVVFASLMQQENLARSMVNGRKQGKLTDAIRWNWWPVAVLLLGAVLSFWWLQWQSPLLSTTPAAGLSAGHDGDDD